MSLMAANEESDPSAILNDFWVTLFLFYQHFFCFINLQIKDNSLILDNIAGGQE